jgi:hypothetical protein
MSRAIASSTAWAGFEAPPEAEADLITITGRTAGIPDRPCLSTVYRLIGRIGGPMRRDGGSSVKGPVTDRTLQYEASETPTAAALGLITRRCPGALR